MLPQRARERAQIRRELAWLDDRPPLAGWRCADCGRPAIYAPSVTDPTRCSRCAHARRTAELAQRYAWRPGAGPIRRYRKVPPAEAAQWE